MTDCMHSAIAPNMNRCIKCGAWVGLGPEPAASGGDSASLVLERFGCGPAGSPYLLVPMSDGYWTPWHIAQKALDESRLNEHFGKPEQFDVNEPSGNSRQLPSLEQRARRLPAVPQAFFDEFGVNADDRVMDYGRACYEAALANQQGVGSEADSVRLNWLEHMARSGGIFLYNGVDVVQEKRSAVGLGLRPGTMDRTLREAIDSAFCARTGSSTQPAGDVGSERA